MADIDIKVIDNSAEVLQELERKVQAALEACGQQAVSHAKQNITAAGRVDTGTLRNSVNHIVQNDICYVGTNTDYAIYNEFGTGIHAEGGKGRKGWWVFVPNSTTKGKGSGKTYTKEQAARIVAMLRAKGVEAHMTNGMKPIHFLKNAIANHISEYKGIIEQYLKR